MHGYFLNSFRKRYLARFAGQLRNRIYGKMEPADLIPAHVYDRETAGHLIALGVSSPFSAQLEHLRGGCSLH